MELDNSKSYLAAQIVPRGLSRPPSILVMSGVVLFWTAESTRRLLTTKIEARVCALPASETIHLGPQNFTKVLGRKGPTGS